MAVSLLLTFDGADGATTAPDKSGTHKSISFTGAASLSSTQKKYGATSLRISSGADAVTSPAHADFALGTGDFTISAYVLIESFATQTLQGFFNIGHYGDGCLARITPIALEFWLSGKAEVAVTFTTGVFHHVEYCRVSGTIYFFLDGVLKGTASKPGDIPARDISIGNTVLSGSEYVHGYVDNVYVNKGEGLHTTDFTPPGNFEFGDAFITGTSPTIVSYGGGHAGVIAPSPLFKSHGGGFATVTAPMATFFAGPIESGAAALFVPSPTVHSAGGATSAITGTSPTLSARGHGSTDEQSISITAPSPLLTITTGANGRVTAPNATLAAAGTVTGWAKATIAAPTATLSAAGTVSAMAGASMTAPSPNLIGYGGAVCSVTLTGKATVQATGNTGVIGGAQITCPLFRLSASGTAQNYGSANLIAPSAQLGAQAQAYLIAPGARLTAIGTATVTATYEAYAVNLNHVTKPGPAPIDETTRYTNFPFTHVVRYLNSYFGVNNTGLYLLEGTTDDGTPIEWNVQTATTDFGTPQLKTVEMAFFGGRFGPASEITLFSGETAGDPYVYTTPRDTTAKNYRQTFGRGLKARYYALAAKGADELVLDSITLNIANLARELADS